MGINDLRRGRMIARVPVDGRKVRDTLDLARRDLRTAKRTLPGDQDWAFSIAYNSMLQAGRALMFARGYRSAGGAHHVSVVKFVGEALGKDMKKIVVAFDRMRRKRHVAVYGAAGGVSGTEAKNAIERAADFLKTIKGILVKEGFKVE